MKLIVVCFASLVADYVNIHQPSLSVMPEESVRLSCEIQYGAKLDRKVPSIFWFEDIYDVGKENLFCFGFSREHHSMFFFLAETYC